MGISGEYSKSIDKYKELFEQNRIAEADFVSGVLGLDYQHPKDATDALDYVKERSPGVVPAIQQVVESWKHLRGDQFMQSFREGVWEAMKDWFASDSTSKRSD